VARIPNLDASKITSGTLNNSRLPLEISVTSLAGTTGKFNTLEPNSGTSVSINSNVGIGITSPLAKLHIVGGIASNVTVQADPNYPNTGFGDDYAFLYHDGFDTNANYFQADYLPNPATYGANDGLFGIYADKNIISKQWFVSHRGTIKASDRRIKRDIVDIDDTSALDQLRLLTPKKYRYINRVEHGNEEVIGFIAQEVKSVIPLATVESTSEIPNILSMGVVSDSNVITFINFDTSQLDQSLKTIMLKNVHGNEVYTKIEEIIDSNTIRVNTNLDEHKGAIDVNGNVVPGNYIFVYGEVVEDFTYLKKDSIFTVATAALQEVDRQQQADKQRIATLESQVADLLARVQALESP
jgi:hypothetical protein